MSKPAAKVIPIQSVSLYQKQAKIYPKAVSGWFARWRWVMVWLTQLFFYGAPWLQWNDRQALLFDLEQRRFFLFGLVLYPQDLIYLTALLVISALGLFFFTAVAGRLWCGYACPQSVYTQIFMWVERHTEGDRIARMRLDKAPWSAEKLLRKGGKHVAWVLIALVTGFSFVGYFTPIRTLTAELMSFSLTGWEAFWVLFYGFATWGNAGFMREQVCTYMCPYARFQGALIDRDSMIITYDAPRGDPRGSRPRSADPKALGKGDCIDCGLCVQVCPTGIDIRNGLQVECIGCAACIDVCNGVMDKMGYAKGLIRYSTENGVAQALSRAQMFARVLRPRVLIYGALLAAVSIAFIASLALRNPFHVDLIKDRNTLARMVEDGRVENVYRLQLMNGTESAARYRVSVSGLPGLTIAGASELEVPAAQIGSLPLQLQIPGEEAQQLQGRSSPVLVEVARLLPDGSQQVVREKTTFVVPR
ncbi:cytochrome c oxidase accessory protein CcoG [Azohydromonas caseinilytica]|uniref:Cytochrome c oxidase accessory protein CcoG n=1 Tax=Azohydromonas caseinilytica TaxID=2728836 RepID=A0A848F961_9BURK|nr:cytochrome c oxidase accessory protein CcoG [Azohydromonas caseinilytica]NML15245.1 cytochrome c oxidase accessory protein CcoG [Azohydromonas caseinilytica]